MTSIIDHTQTPPRDILIVGSNFHTFGDYPYTAYFSAAKNCTTFPENVTLGFRGVFWKVFPSLSEYAPPNVELSWLNQQWEVLSLWVAELDDAQFEPALNEPRNWLLLFMLHPLNEQPPRISDSITAHGINEQAAITELIEAFAGTEIHAFLKTFRHARALHSLLLWHGSAPSRLQLSTLAALFAFHALALLMTWRVGRAQANMNLTPTSKEFLSQIQALLRIRRLIINIERLLLTQNISNDPDIKAVARSMRNAFRVRQKLDGLLPLNEAIQRYLDSAAQLRGDVKATILNATALVIALIGLPLSLISMLLAINATVPVIKNGMSYVREPHIGNFLLLASGLAMATVAAVVALAYLFAITRGRHRF